MNARELIDSITQATKEHPLIAELLAAFFFGVVVGAWVF